MKSTFVVTGGRSYPNAQEVVEETLDLLEGSIGEIFHSDATGVDEAARLWANKNDVPHWEFPADWNCHIKSAEPLRNREMLEKAGLDSVVLAFPGGKGTESCVKLARGKGMLVLRVEP